jgi:hypothetical protein
MTLGSGDIFPPVTGSLLRQYALVTFRIVWPIPVTRNSKFTTPRDRHLHRAFVVQKLSSRLGAISLYRRLISQDVGGSYQRCTNAMYNASYQQRGEVLIEIDPVD